MPKIDFHTHTVYSRDAFTSMQQLERFFRTNPDFILAITDHDEIEGALEAKNRFGEQVIVGEEIKTRQGEIIGFYLTEYIEPGLDLEVTISKIRQQDGLVSVPHPFKRHGKSDSPVPEKCLTQFIDRFDFIEIFNARNRTVGANHRAKELAEKFDKPQVIGSDSHAVYELGRTYAYLPEYSGKKTLAEQLRQGAYICQAISFPHRLLTRIQRELKRDK